MTPEQKEARKLYMKKYRELNKEKTKAYMKEYTEVNKDGLKKKRKKYYEKNKCVIADKIKSYQKVNKDKINKNKNIYRKNKRQTDELYNLKHCIRALITMSFNEKGLKKLSRTSDILGCSFEQFKQHIESKFESWMNWQNKGLYNGELNYGWDIDHIIPLSSAKTEEDVIKLNHYSNLRPLCSKVNRDIKRDNFLIS